MEPHKELSSTEEFIEHYSPPFADAHTYFSKAKVFADKFYSEDIKRMQAVSWDTVGPSLFFEEYVWVACATGFSAKAVSKFISRLIDKLGWYDELALEEFENVFERVKTILNNRDKIKAMHKTAKMIREGVFIIGWDKWKQEYASTPEKLQKLPYIGKVTCFHLARNIGLMEVVKPDLHLVRMARHWGYKDCMAMCEDVRPGGMPLGIVDYIFWIAAATFGTTEIRKKGER
jgi:hypothetical protein